VEQLRLVRHERQQPLRLDRLAHDVPAANGDGARAWCLDADDTAEGGRFPGAVGADQADDFSRSHVDRQVVDGLELAVRLGEALDVDHARRALSSASARSTSSSRSSWANRSSRLSPARSDFAWLTASSSITLSFIRSNVRMAEPLPMADRASLALPSARARRC